MPQGQGHRTVVAQVIADELGLKPSDIQVIAEMVGELANPQVRFPETTKVMTNSVLGLVRDAGQLRDREFVRFIVRFLSNALTGETQTIRQINLPYVLKAQ